jgi:hypothetical protein
VSCCGRHALVAPHCRSGNTRRRNRYTDTSGTPRYNKGLSERRASAVAAELMRDGVPQSAIEVQGLGDTNLLVQTGPGLREPQNRRVEILSADTIIIAVSSGGPRLRQEVCRAAWARAYVIRGGCFLRG